MAELAERVTTMESGIGKRASQLQQITWQGRKVALQDQAIRRLHKCQRWVLRASRIVIAERLTDMVA